MLPQPTHSSEMKALTDWECSNFILKIPRQSLPPDLEIDMHCFSNGTATPGTKCNLCDVHNWFICGYFYHLVTCSKSLDSVRLSSTIIKLTFPSLPTGTDAQNPKVMPTHSFLICELGGGLCTHVWGGVMCLGAVWAGQYKASAEEDSLRM